MRPDADRRFDLWVRTLQEDHLSPCWRLDPRKAVERYWGDNLPQEFITCYLERRMHSRIERGLLQYAFGLEGERLYWPRKGKIRYEERIEGLMVALDSGDGVADSGINCAGVGAGSA